MTSYRPWTQKGLRSILSVLAKEYCWDWNSIKDMCAASVWALYKEVIENRKKDSNFKCPLLSSIRKK